MTCILSIDVGTTNVKASLVNEEGTLLGITRRQHQIHRGASGRTASHHPEDLMKSIIKCSKEAIEGRESETELVVVSSYQYGLVILNSKMKPISNISTLLDIRSKETYQEFLQETDAAKLYETTGCPSFTQSILPRLFYFKKNMPERIKNGRHFLSSKAWILYNFTGKLVTEASTESVTQFLDINKLKWRQDILDTVGISEESLPEIVEPMADAYSIKEEIRKAIGLKSDCKIIPGVYDGGAICLGMDCYHSGHAISNIGTSGMLRVLSKELILDDSSKMRYQPFYLMDGKYLIGGATNNAALPLKWFKENLLELGYDEIDRLAHGSPVGSNSLFSCPT